MSVERFLDTNILLYAYDLDAPAKRKIASGILEEAWHHPRSTAISVQVLQEFHVNFVRAGHSREEANELIGDFSVWSTIDNTSSLFHNGLSLQARWDLSLWDAMILAAAGAARAEILLTEDFNHGQDYGGIRAINPFR